jgi:hypothetical protein
MSSQIPVAHVRIYLSDGTFKSVDVTPTSNVGEVTRSMCRTLMPIKGSETKGEEEGEEDDLNGGYLMIAQAIPGNSFQFRMIEVRTPFYCDASCNL